MSLLRYKYVGNSPVNYRDLYGYYSECNWYDVFCHGGNGIESAGNVAAATGSFALDFGGGMVQLGSYAVQEGHVIAHNILNDEGEGDTDLIRNAYEEGRGEFGDGITYIQAEMLGASTTLLPEHCQEGLVAFVPGPCGATSVLVDGYRPTGAQAIYLGMNTALDASIVGGLGKAAVTKGPKLLRTVKAVRSMSKSELVVKASSYGDDFLRVCKNVLDDAFKKGGDDLSKVRSGTNIPKSFKIVANGTEYRVHPNATKHMGELLNGSLGGPASSTNLASQLVMGSFDDAVKVAISGGNLAKGRNFITVGNWELGIDTLTNTIYHALYTP